MADEKAQVTPEAKPEAKPETKVEAKVEEKKVEAKKQDSNNEIDWKAKAEKLENDVKSWEGRFTSEMEKYKPLKKIVEALAPEATEEQDPAMLALETVEKIQKELQTERAENAKEKYINSLEIPEEAKKVLRVSVSAGNDLEVRINQVLEALTPLTEKIVLPKPRPQGFVGDNSADLSDANAWLKKK